MKRILSFAVIAGGLVAFASCNNSATVDNKDTTTIVATEPVVVTPTYSEGDVISREGKIYTYKNGDWVAVEKDVTLDNGVVVKTSGEAVDKNGKVVVLEEGEYVNRTGNFFDRTGAAIDNAWDRTKAGVEKAADATKSGLQKVGDSISVGAKRVGEKIEDAVK